LSHGIVRDLIESGLHPLVAAADNMSYFRGEVERWTREYDAMSDDEQRGDEGRKLYDLIKGYRLILESIVVDMLPYCVPRLSRIKVDHRGMPEGEQETLTVIFPEKGDELI
jgi:hypothetical protein